MYSLKNFLQKLRVTYYVLSVASLGFSLVELLVVVALLGGLAVATSRVFFANLRGSEKTQEIIQLRQAGDQALLTIKNTIRNAREVECGPGNTSIRVVRRDPSKTGLGSPQTITNTFTCFSTLQMSTDGGTVDLTPANLELRSCSFSCSGSPVNVAINFSLRDPETLRELNFSSTVSLRNF